ncbi:DMT family transporter [Iodobacter fluviatilis]|jgi:drug/metabolite transporter (DMT)-like permease|uniref:EamA family transporter n=1 Tax=Iodobacter fluviatilis TaxID=537 RepID=A0A7G3G9S8_9NEIS|nr:DMT family transporter [Iodobacter fluviatilis]QBC43986.1 EamA family transporter [Iodobacter fluviatilis]
MHIFFPLLAVMIWATNTVVSKAAAGVLEPGAISFYRWFLAALILTPFCLKAVWQQRQAIRPYLSKFVVLALLGMVLFQCIAYYAAHSTTATNMGVITSLVPLSSLLLNAFMTKTKPSMAASLGIFLSLCGVLFLLGKGHPASLLHSGINHGDALMLAGTVAYALYGILLRRWALPFKHWHSLYIQIVLAVLILIPVAFSTQSMAIPAEGVGLVLFAGIASSLVAAYCWMHGVHHLGADRTAVFMNLLPLFTALIAMFTLGEAIQIFHLLGGGLVLLGVIVAQMQSWKKLSQSK